MRPIPVVSLLIFPASLAAQSVGPLEEYVDVLASIALEESDSVLTVGPIVVPDPLGGFIVADARDAQVRLYDEGGRLTRLVATRGSGPGEVRTPASVLRRADGKILVADVQAGTIIEFDSSGTEEVQRYPTAFPVIRLLDLGRHVLAATVRPPPQGAPPPPLLYLWDGASPLRGDRGGFFPMPDVRVPRRIAATYGSASAAVSRDEIFATYSLSDTLYVFSRDGEPVAKLDLDLQHWSVPSSLPEGAPGSPARQNWLEGFTQIFDVHVAADRILVQYAGRRGRELVWRLACITREGRKVFDVLDTPRLLAADGDRLYFVDAESLTEDHWVVASLR